jgi:signal transduction histidine kinase
MRVVEGHDISDGLVGPESPLPLGDLADMVLHHLPLGVVIFDRQGEIRVRNDAADLFLPPVTSIVAALNGVALESGYEDWDRELNAMMEGRSERVFDCIAFRREGLDDRLMKLIGVPIENRDKSAVVGGMLVLEEITSQISMEKRLAISERLAAVGKLAARVAHELNNPLDGILRYINLTRRVMGGPDQSKAEGYLDESKKGLMRMVRIVRELLEFSRSAQPALEVGNINTFIDDAIKSLTDRAGEQAVTIVTDFEEPMPTVRGSNLFQVFYNLIKNALDAMPDGGTLAISSSIEGRQVILDFADTGPGLPEESEKVFEPFYTTKPLGQGTGLGLAICKDIVERYNGRLTGGNRQEGGAQFLIRIPVESCISARDSDEGFRAGFSQTKAPQGDA